MYATYTHVFLASRLYPRRLGVQCNTSESKREYNHSWVLYLVKIQLIIWSWSSHVRSDTLCKSSRPRAKMEYSSTCVTVIIIMCLVKWLAHSNLSTSFGSWWLGSLQLMTFSHATVSGQRLWGTCSPQDYGLSDWDHFSWWHFLMLMSCFRPACVCVCGGGHVIHKSQLLVTVITSADEISSCHCPRPACGGRGMELGPGRENWHSAPSSVS